MGVSFGGHSFKDFEEAFNRIAGIIGINNQRVDSLPTDVDRVIINGTTVIVYLRDGSKGKAHCDYMDTFDPYVGFVLAYHKCKNGKNGSLKNVLDSCIKSAKRKGYKQAILKNYDN